MIVVVDDIVAVKVTLDTGEHRYFLTWGRIQDTVDPATLEAIVLERSGGFALRGKAVSAQVCASLHAAERELYFHECFFAMCQTRIPFGPDYQNWRAEMDAKMREGKELYFLGVALRPDIPP